MGVLRVMKAVVIVYIHSLILGGWGGGVDQKRHYLHSHVYTRVSSPLHDGKNPSTYPWKMMMMMMMMPSTTTTTTAK